MQTVYSSNGQNLRHGVHTYIWTLLSCVRRQVLEKNRIKTIADVKRVSREIKILKRVRHPNVIALYEVLDTPSTIYFMMEHCDGCVGFEIHIKYHSIYLVVVPDKVLMHVLGAVCWTRRGVT